ncbi:MAG TPA: hypothetical protein VGK41_02145 [Solirubrobacterales bacterium]
MKARDIEVTKALKDLDQVRTLAQAAEELGLGKETLRTQWRRGRFAAREVGSVLLTTVDEIERYRRESLGQAGRPPKLVSGAELESPPDTEEAEE